MSDATLDLVRKTRPRNVARAIRRMRNTASRRTLMVWGPPGIGKSQVALQVANEWGIAFIDVRLAQMDPTDLRGIPFPIVEHGVHGIRWSAPLVLPRDIYISRTLKTDFAEPIVFSFENINPKGKNGIHYVRDLKVAVKAVGTNYQARIISQSLTHVEAAIFDEDDAIVPGAINFTISGECEALVGLEELNSAPPSVLAASYELLNDLRSGEYVAPAKAYFMGMGNRDTDKGVTFKMSPVVMNRMVHIEMEIHNRDFQDHAVRQMFHPEVVAYIEAFPQKLMMFEPTSGARGFPTPRSWEGVSEILYAGDPETREADEDIEADLVCGAIGEGVGMEFMAFRKIAQSLPKPEQILSGEVRRLRGDITVDLGYALVTTLCYSLKISSDAMLKKHGMAYKKSPEAAIWYKQCDNYFRFMLENFDGVDGNAGAEIAVLGGRFAMFTHSLPVNAKVMPFMNSFAEKYMHLVNV